MEMSLKEISLILKNSESKLRCVFENYKFNKFRISRRPIIFDVTPEFVELYRGITIGRKQWRYIEGIDSLKNHIEDNGSLYNESINKDLEELLLHNKELEEYVRGCK